MYGDLTAKSLEILHTMLPNARKIAVLMSSNPTHPPLYELERGFQDIKKANCDAVFVLADPIRLTIATLAAGARIPAIYQISEFVEAGGLASYGAILAPMWRRSADYIDKIFKGANPADLPVEQPTKFDLVINLKTAKTLGLQIPESFLLRADKVIE